MFQRQMAQHYQQQASQQFGMAAHGAQGFHHEAFMPGSADANNYL